MTFQHAILLTCVLPILPESAIHAQGADDCANAQPISGVGLFVFDNTNATQDGPGHPDCNVFGSDQIDYDVWFAWTPLSSGYYGVSTCALTAIDSKMAIYDGVACPPGPPLDCTDDASGCGLLSAVLLEGAVGGQTYLIRVGAFPSTQGGLGQIEIREFEEGLSGHYKLDETTGGVAFDSSVESNDGFFEVGALLGQPGAAPGTNTAVEFSGTGARVRIATSQMLNSMRDNYTIAAWIRPDTLGPGWRRIFGNKDSVSFGIFDDRIGMTLNGGTDLLGPSVITAGAWQHVAMTFDENSEATFYVDGLPVGTAMGSVDTGGPEDEWFIGAQSNTGMIAQFFDGAIDDLQLYNTLFADADVAFLYSSPGSTLGQPVGTSYCISVATSAGTAAVISGTGSASTSASALHLKAEGLPLTVPGIFFTGSSQILAPFGDGFRCVGGQVLRFPFGMSNAIGELEYTPDFQAPPSAGNLVAGTTWNFQAWFRDPDAGGTGFNLSDGLEVALEP